MFLQELLHYTKKMFSFLFEEESFIIAYTFERHAPTHIRIGLVSEKIPYLKILFVHEWATSVLIGAKNSDFKTDTDWLDVGRVVDFLSGQSLRWTEDQINIPYKKFLLTNLERRAEELNKNYKIIHAIFKDEKNFTQWKDSFDNYIDSEIRRKYSLR